MPRRLTVLAGPLATATLALGTAAWAATADVPLAAGDRARALAVAAEATGPLVANDHDGSAILSAGALVPGQAQTGEVTISNAGDAAGAFSLSASGAAGPLADVLDLSVVDATDADPVTVFAGKLADFRRTALGTFEAGAARHYRFELAYPTGGSAEADNALQGATTSVQFDWDAVATRGASPVPTPVPAGPPAPAPAPVPSAPSTTTRVPAPAPRPAPAALTVALGPAARPISGGRLVTWMSSSTPASAEVTGTVAFSGHRLKLRPTTVSLTAKRRTVRLRLPAAAVARGAKRRLTVRLAITATAGAHKATVKRTLSVTAP